MNQSTKKKTGTKLHLVDKKYNRHTVLQMSLEQCFAERRAVFSFSMNYYNRDHTAVFKTVFSQGQKNLENCMLNSLCSALQKCMCMNSDQHQELVSLPEQ